MFELLTHEAVAYYLTEDDWARNEVFHDIPNLRNPKYSGALTELIRLCLMPDPWDRPSIEELELKIGAKCQSILDEYAANPSLRERDHLYYKGSEIKEMPPGNWNYWHPIMEIVQRPSEPPDSNEPKNPFTSTIVYPPFPTSTTDGLVDGPEEAQDGGDNDENKDDENNANNPLVISGSEEGDGVDESGEVNEGDAGDGGDEADKGDESNGSEDRESSDDSDARRRRAIKKPPGT